MSLLSFQQLLNMDEMIKSLIYNDGFKSLFRNQIKKLLGMMKAHNQNPTILNPKMQRNHLQNHLHISTKIVFLNI